MWSWTSSASRSIVPALSAPNTPSDWPALYLRAWPSHLFLVQVLRGVASLVRVSSRVLTRRSPAARHLPLVLGVHRGGSAATLAEVRRRLRGFRGRARLPRFALLRRTCGQGADYV